MSNPATTASPLANDPFLRDVPEVDGWKVLAPAVLYAKIGQGGMGAVYRGKHLELEIDVAVKCLKPSLVAEDEQFEARFRREARLAAELTHENLVRLYELRRAHGLSYLILEFVEGETARDRVLRKGPLREEEAAAIVLAASRGLAKAHLHPEVIVHRDIKPENILISKRGDVKLADLGIAKALEGGDDNTFTTQGVIGTPAYMAPEQWDDQKQAGPQTDVWAMGVTLYFLLTGRNAMRGATAHQIYNEVVNRAFPDPRLIRQDLSAEIVRILQRCTQKEPEKRYPDASALVQDLQDFLGARSLSLLDRDSGSVQSTAPLLSPPPEHALRKIRAASHGVETKSPPLASTTPLRTEPAAKGNEPRDAHSGSKRRLAIVGAAAVLLALVLLFVRNGFGVPPEKQSAKGGAASSEKTPLEAGDRKSAPAIPGEHEALDQALLGAENSAAGAPSYSGKSKAMERAPDGWEIVDATPGFGGWAKKVREPNSGVVFLLVAPGTFQMGSPGGEERRDSDEQQHPVTLTKAFYLAETETTQEQYQRVTGGNPSNFKGANLPVETVDWNQSRAFCQKIGCELPTEAQWEYACRAGTTTPFSFGATISASQVNYDASSNYGSGIKGQYRQKTTSVKGFPANAWGLFDMHGNVWEWCLDSHRADYQTLASQDPVQLEGAPRVLRGGSWSTYPGFCRSAYRRSDAPSSRVSALGFRAAKTLP